MKRLFLFDLDGTLVSTGGAGRRSLTRTFLDVHGVADASSRINLAGRTDPAIFRELTHIFLQRALEPGELERLVSVYLSHLEREMTAPGPKGPYEGVVEFLELIAGHPDVVLSLGTGNMERGARLKLAPFDLNRYFPDGGFGSDAEDRAELLRFGWRRAQERIGEKIPVDRVYVIGDTPRDVAAARASGFQAIGVATGGCSFDELETCKPDHLMKTLREGAGWFRGILSGRTA